MGQTEDHTRRRASQLNQETRATLVKTGITLNLVQTLWRGLLLLTTNSLVAGEHCLSQGPLQCDALMSEMFP